MLRIRKFLPRELEAAKQHPSSRARTEILENGLHALLVLSVYGRGDIEPISAGDLATALLAVTMAQEVLDHGTR